MCRRRAPLENNSSIKSFLSAVVARHFAARQPVRAVVCVAVFQRGLEAARESDGVKLLGLRPRPQRQHVYDHWLSPFSGSMVEGALGVKCFVVDGTGRGV